MIAASIVCSAGCDRGRDARIASLAEELNPALATLEDTPWHLLLDTGWNVDAARGTVSACTSKDPTIERIGRIDTKIEHRSLGSPDVAEIAKHLIDDRHLYCGDEVERCARWCVVTWTRLVLAVEDLRTRAAKGNVEIVSISPLDPRNRLAPNLQRQESNP